MEKNYISLYASVLILYFIVYNIDVWIDTSEQNMFKPKEKNEDFRNRHSNTKLNFANTHQKTHLQASLSNHSVSWSVILKSMYLEKG